MQVVSAAEAAEAAVVVVAAAAASEEIEAGVVAVDQVINHQGCSCCQTDCCVV